MALLGCGFFKGKMVKALSTNLAEESKKTDGFLMPSRLFCMGNAGFRVCKRLISSEWQCSAQSAVCRICDTRTGGLQVSNFIFAATTLAHRPLLHYLCISQAALGNLKMNFHCSRLH